MLLNFFRIPVIIQYVFKIMRYAFEVLQLVKDMQSIIYDEFYYIKLLIYDYEFCVKSLHILCVSR